MAKSISQHIQEKHDLIDAALPLLVLVEKDLWSYGYGALYDTTGRAAADLVQAISAIEPNYMRERLESLPKIREFFTRL